VGVKMFVCGVCGEKIIYKEKRIKKPIKCKNCGKVHEVKESRMDILRCGCGSIIYLKDSQIYHINK
jgi:transcription elongation factor Elf1